MKALGIILYVAECEIAVSAEDAAIPACLMVVIEDKFSLVATDRAASVWRHLDIEGQGLPTVSLCAPYAVVATFAVGARRSVREAAVARELGHRETTVAG